MSGRSHTLFLPALFVTFLSGCTSSPEKLYDYLDLNALNKKFVKTHEQMARKYEAEGALNDARREWQLIAAVQQPEVSLAQNEISRLERKAALRVKEHLTAARRAERRADYKAARLELLKALALEPDNVSAIKKIKALEVGRSYATLALVPRVSDIVESEVEVYTAPHVHTWNDNNGSSLSVEGKARNARVMLSKEQTKKSVRKSRAKGGENNFQRGVTHFSRKEYKLALQYFLIARNKDEGEREILDDYLVRTRQALASQHYNQGVVAFRAARYDQAVDEFEQALEYAPEHKKARFYHSSAKALVER